MKKYFLLLTILLLLNLQGQGQGNRVSDSLRQLVSKSSAEDTNRVRLLFDLTRTFYPRQLDSVEKYAGEGLRISERLDYTYGIITGINHMATISRFRNDFIKARELYLKAFSMAEDERMVEFQVSIADNIGLLYNSMGKTDSAEYFFLKAVNVGKDYSHVKHYSKALSDLAMNYRVRANYTDAIRYQLEARRIDRDNGNRANEIPAAIRLGLIYAGIRDFDRAIAVYREALRLNDSLRNDEWYEIIFQNIGLLYTDVKWEPDSARYYLTRAADLASKNDHPENIFAAQVNLGNVETMEKNFSKALGYYLKAAESPVFLKRKLERAGTLVNLGIAYLELKNLKEAEQYAREGTALAHEGKFLDFEMTGLNTLARIAASKNDFKSAFRFKMRADTLNDTIYYDQIKSRVAEAIYQEDLKQAERENSILQQDNQLKKQTILIQWIALGLVVLLVVVLAVVVVYIKKTSRKLSLLNQELDHKTKALEELNITKDKFISIIAHDLRSPFQSLLGLLGELDEHYDEFDEQSRQRILKMLRKSSQNIYNLLVNLLDWTQAQKGKLQRNMTDFDINASVNEVFEILGTRASLKNQLLLKAIPDRLMVHSDQQMLKSVLLNLLNNGIKFTPAGGRIEVAVEKNERSLKITVSDTGIGIPTEKIPDLFRLGAGFNRKGTEQEPGTGLGLILCHEYVTLLGGSLSVTSQPGEGTTFSIDLPVD
jgi:signal transduction histidine kinase